MKQLMVVTELKQGESGWSVELKTVDSAGQKDYRGFAVLPIEDRMVLDFHVGALVQLQGAPAVVEVAQ